VTRRAALALIPAALVAMILAYLLRDAIQRAVILPLAYLWWIAGLYYHTVPQIVFWILLVAGIFFAGAQSFISAIGFTRREKSAGKPITGQVQELAAALERSPEGTYLKWTVAHRLGKLARGLLSQREGRSAGKGLARLEGRDWSPPEPVARYLEAGLNGSFADYPRQRWPAAGRPPIPLDLDPGDAVRYLESQMETQYDRDS
jgi:hypothetical protein